MGCSSRSSHTSPALSTASICLRYAESLFRRSPIVSCCIRTCLRSRWSYLRCCLQDLPPADWASSYSEGQRLRARILYIDPANKAVYLSLRRHLLAASVPDSLPSVGAVYEGATVQRVDPGLGVLLELPAGTGHGSPAAGFAHISNLSDERLDRVEKVRSPRNAGFEPLSSMQL